MLVFLTLTSVVRSVVDLLKAMSQIWHTFNELRSLNYAKMRIEVVNFLPVKFDGDMLFEFPPICNTPLPSCIIGHKICGSSIMCVQTCICRIYYVVHSSSDLSKVAIHLKTHEHLISEGKCIKAFKEMKSMVIEFFLHMPNVASSTISLAASTMFLFRHLFNEDGEVPMEVLKDGKLNQTMSMFLPLCYLNIRNLISSIKHRSRNMGFLTSILAFKYFPLWINKVTCVVVPKREHTQFIFLFKFIFL